MKCCSKHKICFVETECPICELEKERLLDFNLKIRGERDGK